MFVLQNTAEVISASAQGSVTLTFIISAGIFLNFSLFENFFIIFLRNFICGLCKIYNMNCRLCNTAKTALRHRAVSDCRKSLFFKNVAYSQTLTPNPFPSGRAILLGLPPLVPVGGFAPKQGCFGCLPKVLHDAKPAEQAILDTPFSKKYRFIDRLKPPCVTERLYKILFYDKCKVTCRIAVYIL